MQWVLVSLSTMAKHKHEADHFHRLFFFLRLFPHLWVNFSVVVSSCLYLPSPVFHLALPVSSSALYSSLNMHGLPIGFLLLIFISNNLFGILLSSVPLICPDHLGLLLSIHFCISSILSSPLMMWLLLCLLVCPTIPLKFTSI